MDLMQKISMQFLLPPTKILLDLLARQVDENNDDLYREMRPYNPSTTKLLQDLAAALDETKERDVPKRIRDLFGDDLLKEAQARAKKMVE